MSYIYKVTNQINGKVYIGKTMQTIPKRWLEHCNEYSKDRSKNRPLYLAMQKYGIENFFIEEIEEVQDIQELDDRERYWIEYFHSFYNGYNATIGGDGKPYIDRQVVCILYTQLGSCVKVAKAMQIDEQTVSLILKEQNVQVKSSQQHAKENYSKKVLMTSLDKTKVNCFPSLKDAARFLVQEGITSGELRGISAHIRQVCNKQRKTAYTMLWEWVE